MRQVIVTAPATALSSRNMHTPKELWAWQSNLSPC